MNDQTVPSITKTRTVLSTLRSCFRLTLHLSTNVEAGHGLLKIGSSLVPFENSFPKNTKLYDLMTTKPSEIAESKAREAG